MTASPTNSHELPAKPGPCVFDRQAALEKLDGDEDFLAEIVSVFLSDGPQLMEAMRTALASRQAADLRRAAHTLKGSAGYLAATTVTAAALQVETASDEPDLRRAAEAFERLQTEVHRLTPHLLKIAKPLASPVSP